MLVQERMNRRQLLRKLAAVGTGLALAGPILAACGPTPTPQIIKEVVKETVVVEKEKLVEKPVEKLVTKEVLKEVTKEVVKEKVVEKPVEKLVTVQVAPKGATEVRAYIGGVADLGESSRRTREYNGVQDKVKIVNVPVPDGWETKIRAQIEKGAPDVDGYTSHHYFRMLALWANLGVVQPIDDYLKATKVLNINDYWNDMVDLANFKWDVSYQDKVYGIPMAMDSTAQGYMISHFKEAGLPSERKDRAKTWDEVLAHAIKLRKWGKEKGIWGMYGWPVYHQTTGALFQSISKNLYTPDGFINVDSDDFRRAMKIMKSWIENDVAPNPVWGVPGQTSNTVGQAGKIAQWQSTLGTPGILQPIWGTASVSQPMPTLVEEGTGGQVFYLTGGYLMAKATHPQEVVDWLLWLYGPQNDENARVLVTGIRWFPVFASQWKKQIDPKPELQWMKEFDRYFKNGKLLPRNLYYEVETATIQKYCELYFAGKLSLEDASKQCNKEMRDEAAKIKAV